MNTHLKSVNPHERDSLIKFYTYGHHYEILSDIFQNLMLMLL